MAIDVALEGYKQCTEWMTSYEWEMEMVIIEELLRGYFNYYRNDPLIEFIHVEVPFNLDLVNPDTNTASRTFQRAGKIDGIIKYDGRGMILEGKTISEDINPQSDYWLRLRCDPQISQYVLAARDLGYDVQSCIYDVIRKPSIRPCHATAMDARKYKKDGTLYANQREVDETPGEFGCRLNIDILDRPEFYFARREIPRLEDDLKEFREEMWQIGQMLIACRNKRLWFRSVSKPTCSNCEYADLCLNSIKVDPEKPPEGWVILENKHPELGGDV
jgi:hypothetical protein